MMVFIWGFLAGGFLVAAAIAWFISWAISGAEKSLNEDIEEQTNDTL